MGKQHWMRPRHRLIRNLAYCVLAPVAWLKFGAKIEKFKEQEKRPYLILLNHTTAFDQFFVGMAFKGPIYYMATEDIFSKGWISSLLRFAIAPIPIKKQTTDLRAVKTCLKVAKEGGTIAIAPEGNRTYSGKTEYMNPAIAPLARKLGLPLVLFRIEGGYGVQPRWSDCIRKGKIRAYVGTVVQPEEYAGLTNEELMALIEKELMVNDAKADATYRHKNAAEYLERAIYICPKCGLSTFESHGDTIACKKCGLSARYLPTTELEGVPYRFVNDWYEAQKKFINQFDSTAHTEVPLYEEKTELYEVIVYKNKKLIQKDAPLILYGNRLILNGEELPFDALSAITVLGRNKLNIYHDGRVYQLKSGKRFNALKYVQLFHRYKNIAKGEEDGEFLGL